MPDDAPDAASPLRLVEIPAGYLPEWVDSSAMDPDTLRLAAQAHASARGAVDTFTVKPWVVLYLLDVWEAATECCTAPDDDQDVSVRLPAQSYERLYELTDGRTA